LMIVLLPMYLPAHLLITTKCELITKADDHRKKAIYNLDLLEDMCWYIPDLSKREHMKNLISAAIGSIPFKDPKATLLGCGLTIIGSLASDMYDEYLEMRTLLANA